MLNRHSHGLKDYLKSRAGHIDKKMFTGALESAILHLHSLGWAHNINPTNVLVNESETTGGTPVLMDFYCSFFIL